MKNILNTEELLSLDHNLAPVKRKTIIHMVTFIAGVAAIFFGTHITAPDYICYLLAVGGIILSIIAICNIFIQPHDIVNQKTNEILHKQKMYFYSKDEKEVIQDIHNGKLKSLLNKTCQSGQLLAIVYASQKNDYYVAQIFKFVPYEFQPYTEPIIYHS